MLETKVFQSLNANLLSCELSLQELSEIVSFQRETLSLLQIINQIQFSMGSQTVLSTFRKRMSEQIKLTSIV
jgi:hypothetical protein